MTMAYREVHRCAVCRQESEQWVLASTSSFGACDLDTRPPQMARSSIHYWVARCPSCGYCNSRIAKRLRHATKTVRSAEYQTILADERVPSLVRSFRCQAMLLERASDIRGAFWASLHAAWAADDSAAKEVADDCRLRSIRLLGALHESGAHLFDGSEADCVMMSDLLRRNGRFDEAKSYVLKSMGTVTSPPIRRLLEEELRHIEDRNAESQQVPT